MNDTSSADRRSSDDDLYATLMLSNMLDNEQDVKDQQSQMEIQRESTQVEIQEELSDSMNDVIWVPADKHPQIAPIEFANFIKTHGATPATAQSSIRRRKSILSPSMYVKSSQEDEEAELNRTLSEKKRDFLKKVMTESVRRKDSHVFDRNSTSLDDSSIISPSTDKSLLRRSAFSARGRSRKGRPNNHRRSLSQKTPNENKAWDKSAGIDLYDQPVNMSEWIDLGKVSLDSDNSQRGILTRVHDAESQLLTTTTATPPLPAAETPKAITIAAPPKPITIAAPAVNIPPAPKQAPLKRPTIVRSASENATTAASKIKPEKRSSWLGGLFQDKKKDKKPTATTTATTTTTTTNNNTSPLLGLATLFTKSLSIKANASSASKTPSRTPSPRPPSPPTPQIQDKKPSRLEQRTRFNANRLPLHVERAIYRLSHMKLADPKRPLQQQVLISNLMFWYLSIQQSDFQKQEEQRLDDVPSLPAVAVIQKKTSKMTRLIHSAKKRKSEVSQLVQLVEPKKSNVQFSLAPIPSHHQPVLHFEEEDDLPLSRYKSGGAQ